MFTTKLKSVSQMEKVLSKHDYTKEGIAHIIDPLLAQRESGTPKMVPVFHKAPAFVPDEEMFG